LAVERKQLREHATLEVNPKIDESYEKKHTNNHGDYEINLSVNHTN